ncbi:MAG TPA: ornithine carbamoyltransferase [Acidimicrobiia bacterium]
MDFLMTTDLGPDGLGAVLDLAAAVKADRSLHRGTLRGLKVGLFFEKPSTRTRVSCEAAVVDLGAHPVVLKSDEVGLGRREAVADVARVLDRYLDILAFRVFDHRHLVELADNADAPVVNLLSDRSHPCQALADLQTVREHRELAGTILTYVGDGNNVAHSLMLAGAMSGMEIRVAAPPGFEPAADITAEAMAIARTTGGSIMVTSDPHVGVAGADVVYTDVWASMGQEDEAEERRRLFAPFQVDSELFGEAARHAIFLHCLPAHRGEEVTDDVIEHERSFVFDQAENRMHAFKALLVQLQLR